jgi:hypothetical protein
MTDRGAVRERARQLAQERLLRKRALLEAVRPEERAAIEEIAYAIASKVAEWLLDEAARCPTLAAALTAEIPAAASGRRCVSRSLRDRGLRAGRGKPALVGEDHRLHAVAEVELHQDALDVRLDRRLLDHER